MESCGEVNLTPFSGWTIICSQSLQNLSLFYLHASGLRLQEPELLTRDRHHLEVFCLVPWPHFSTIFQLNSCFFGLFPSLRQISLMHFFVFVFGTESGGERCSKNNVTPKLKVWFCSSGNLVSAQDWRQVRVRTEGFGKENCVREWGGGCFPILRRFSSIRMKEQAIAICNLLLRDLICCLTTEHTCCIKGRVGTASSGDQYLCQNKAYYISSCKDLVLHVLKETGNIS